MAKVRLEFRVSSTVKDNNNNKYMLTAEGESELTLACCVTTSVSSQIGTQTKQTFSAFFSSVFNTSAGSGILGALD